MTLKLKEQCDKLFAEIDAEAAKTDAAYAELQRRDSIFLIGWLYSIPAYRRYRRAYDRYMAVYHRNMATFKTLLEA